AAKVVSEEAKSAAAAATAKAEQVQQDVSEARKVANEAKAAAEQAVQADRQAIASQDASVKQLAQEAKSTAEEAKKIADGAKTMVDETKVLAEEAKQAALTANKSSSSSSFHNFLKQINVSALSVMTPFLVATGKKQLTLRQGTHLPFAIGDDILVFSYTKDETISLSQTLTAGKDYYVYLVVTGISNKKFIVSNNSTYPDGYTATNSRKIGGFHTLCADVGTLSAHPLSGYRAGDILPASVWCLNHRPHSSPEGMVYDRSQDLWIDIYLQSGTGMSTKSAYGVPITTNRSYVDHVDDLLFMRKSLLSDIEFASAMYGSNDKTSIQGRKAPPQKHSGGHVDTANKRMISHIGCEDGCGYVWQFLSGTFPMQTAYTLAGRTAFKTVMNVLVGGGSFGHGSNFGATVRSADYGRTLRSDQLGARGCSRPRRYV
ncbi:hypothetical protein NPX99_08595, partial [Bartonella sp. 220]|uniref:phage major tropism determinant n=1 Tax=Bartonella sp. 220B TaxID=2967260 RepID=UPI0022C99AB1|nr:hypothetical protein [Bartonella sp. 220B]